MPKNQSSIARDRITLNTATTANSTTSGWKSWDGGDGSFTAWGTFNSGTIKLQFAPESGTTVASTSFTAIDVPGISLTANGVVNFRLGPTSIRTSLSGSTNPNLNCVILGTHGSTSA